MLRPMIPVVVALTTLLPVSTRAEDSSFRFLAIGDMPYSAEEEVKFRSLVRQSEGEDFAFLMHVGDTKSGGAPCTDEQFLRIRDLFAAYPKPVIYTLGDNEWTDCHATGADPVERLRKLRELFFQDRRTLRLDSLHVVAQSSQPEFSAYPENYRFSKAGVSFIVAHVTGSGNNRRLDDPPSMEEYTARNAATIQFLQESFSEAIKRNVPGVAVVIHANPDFESGRGEGFTDFLAVLRKFLSEFPRPVVCIHGDSHYYRIDKPFRSVSGDTFLHFTRMEVFGSPNIAGVSVTVDPKDPEVFSYRPWYLQDE